MDDISLGHENKHRWNSPAGWVWPTTVAHTPLISTDQFENAQSTIKVGGTSSAALRPLRQ